MGNPLAVVLDGASLDAAQMQSIACEFNLSETTFIIRRDAAIERAEGVRVRIFTTQEELNFAGHPTLGTASVLRELAPEAVRDNTVTLALNVGSVPVRFEDGSAFGAMTQKDPQFGVELDRIVVSQLTGLPVDAIDARHAPRVVSTGTAFAIVLLNSADALAHLRVQHPEATPWLREHGARWFYVLAPTGEIAADGEREFRARMQFYGGEDPATGSAAGCAISFLASAGVVASGERILVRQGVEIGRPSELYLSAKLGNARVTDVQVAGSTVLVAKGQLFLP
jgi:trans-2,3-dihydro-3-hydroxyanthranilate isomerase